MNTSWGRGLEVGMSLSGLGDRKLDAQSCEWLQAQQKAAVRGLRGWSRCLKR